MGSFLAATAKRFPRGVIKRVIEAAYCKVLVPRESLLQPSLDDMTPQVKALYERIYPQGWPANAA